MWHLAKRWLRIWQTIDAYSLFIITLVSCVVLVVVMVINVMSARILGFSKKMKLRFFLWVEEELGKWCTHGKCAISSRNSRDNFAAINDFSSDSINGVCSDSSEVR